MTSALAGGAGMLATAVLGAAAAVGLPLACRALTGRWVRVVRDLDAYGPVFFRLLGVEQQLRAAAARSPHEEVARAAALGPRLLWDAAGLIPAAANNPGARALLLEYEESLSAIVDHAAAVEREHAAVESAVQGTCSPHASCVEQELNEAFPGSVRGAALPRTVLDDAVRDLDELAQGLRHARTVLSAGDITVSEQQPEMVRGEGEGDGES
ncbi:hypothetical protein OG800_49705 (plasmid) [Streptomyces sp. NBC_00445]|uniref:hypothetical protein n=1 Tax=Streptomyces sp. NBC_00445 TaxID=2975745 RepID=UPI002E1DA0DC